MSVAVRIQGLAKDYKLFKGPRALFKGLVLGGHSYELLTALRKISFEVERGEAYGIVGNNGAGKSTLLKILAGSAFATSGEVQVNGRVAALLELGAGFHPEFTGRKNIYFNGAVMGLSRDEIEEREDSIISFSELGDKIDHPVRTYSSGMYLRLGFSVATGFDAEILIIDEALAVGDQYFQKKCTDRVVDFRKAGGTILFCSHNLYQVRTLCDRAIWLDEGEVRALGDADYVVDQYKAFLQKAPLSALDPVSRQPGPVCWIEEVSLTDGAGHKKNEFEAGEDLQLRIRAHFGEGFKGNPGIGLAIVRKDGVVVYATTSTMEGHSLRREDSTTFSGHLLFPKIRLLPGQYYFNVATTDQHNLLAYDSVENREPFRICSKNPQFGICKIDHKWIE